ncbi:4747_t:CDS:1, partial [Funneliformis mosseae]
NFKSLDNNSNSNNSALTDSEYSKDLTKNDESSNNFENYFHFTFDLSNDLKLIKEDQVVRVLI